MDNTPYYAEAYRRATGARSVTTRVERRNLDGTLTVESEATSFSPAEADRIRAEVDAFTAAHPWTSGFPKEHTLQRDGERLYCECTGDSVYAPRLPKPALSPMEASLSRFD